MIISGGGIGNWNPDWFELQTDTDGVDVAGASIGHDPMAVGPSHNYAKLAVPVLAEPDAYVSVDGFGDLIPFLTGVSQFEFDPVNNTGTPITAARLAVGGLQIIKVGAFTNYTYAAGDYVRIDSGTGTTPDYYSIASKDSANQITLSSSAGAGHAVTSDTVFEVIRPNQDAVVMACAYNYAGQAGDKVIADEPCGGWQLETNYTVLQGSVPERHMEFYMTWRTSAGNPGTELRSLGFDYVPAGANAGMLCGAYAMMMGAPYGGRFDFRTPSNTNACVIGWTGTGGGTICGIRHYGSTTEDTVFDIQAGTGRQSKIQFGSNGTAAANVLKSVNASILGFDNSQSGGQDKFRIGYNDGGMYLAINQTDNTSGLTVAPISNLYATAKFKSLSGQTLPAVQARSSADAQTAGIYGENGAILSNLTGGVGYGTGAGGTATQSVGRTAGVTINKTTGSITLVSAAGSASYQSFTVTNSTVAATDVVIVNQKSGTDLYEIHVTAVAAGSFRITFRTTGGTTTEQPVFNFAVIKGVTS